MYHTVKGMSLMKEKYIYVELMWKDSTLRLFLTDGRWLEHRDIFSVLCVTYIYINNTHYFLLDAPVVRVSQSLPMIWRPVINLA